MPGGGGSGGALSREEEEGRNTSPPAIVTGKPPAISISRVPQQESGSLRTVPHPVDEESPQPKYVGLIIGILLTLISLLLVGIFFVIYRGRRGKETPTHSLLATKLHDKLTASIDFKVGTPHNYFPPDGHPSEVLPTFHHWPPFPPEELRGDKCHPLSLSPVPEQTSRYFMPQQMGGLGSYWLLQASG